MLTYTDLLLQPRASETSKFKRSKPAKILTQRRRRRRRRRRWRRRRSLPTFADRLSRTDYRYSDYRGTEARYNQSCAPRLKAEALEDCNRCGLCHKCVGAVVVVWCLKEL